MFRAAAAVLAVAAALAAPALADPVTLVPGVTYERTVDLTPHGPVVLHVVSAPRPGGLLTLQAGLSNDAVDGAEKLTDLERRLQPGATSVGLTADFASAAGQPVGLLLRGGALDHAPLASRTSLLVDSAATLHVDRVKLLATWQGTGPRRSFSAVNAPPPTNGVALFTPAWGAQTPFADGAAVAVLDSLGALTPGTAVSGKVVGVGDNGPTPIPPGGAVLVAHGIAGDYLRDEALVGDTVTIRPVLAPAWTNLTLGIGGGPELVRDGVAVFRPADVFDASYLGSRVARAAIGQRTDGSLLLVAVDGGRPGYSVGMTNLELAQTLVRLGAQTAYGLAARDATTLAFDGGLLSRPSGPDEKPAADALLLSYTGVYVPPLPEPVLSPNGDGVGEEEQLAYRVVRPSQVAATLVDAAGNVVLSDQQHRDPGTYTVTWNGRDANTGQTAPEGRYRWVVNATDDSGQQSSMEQDFQLNVTLSGLVATAATVQAPVAAPRQVATFTLIRPAAVTATIETAGGTPIRTLALGTLPGGPQQPVAWDGLDATGQPAYSGRYQVRVEASNDLGRVDLVTQLSVRRVAARAPARAR